MKLVWLGPAPVAELGLLYAVDDDAEQDQRHAHERDYVRRHFGRGVLVKMAGVISCLEMGHDVGKSSQNEDEEAHSGKDRQSSKLSTAAF